MCMHAINSHTLCELYISYKTGKNVVWRTASVVQSRLAYVITLPLSCLFIPFLVLLDVLNINSHAPNRNCLYIYVWWTPAIGTHDVTNPKQLSNPCFGLCFICYGFKEHGLQGTVWWNPNLFFTAGVHLLVSLCKSRYDINSCMIIFHITSS